jgi:hypothetical protein
VLQPVSHGNAGGTSADDDGIELVSVDRHRG